MTERFASPTADAIRAKVEKCIPGKTWCKFGALIRNEVDKARDNWLYAYASGDIAAQGETSDALLGELDALRDHVRYCYKKEV